MKLTEKVTVRCIVLFVFGILLFPSLVFSQVKTSVNDKLTLEDIFKVWRERQKKAESLSVKWKEISFVPKEYLELSAGSSQTDQTLKTNSEYIISGSNARCERDGKKWDADKKAVVKDKTTSTFHADRNCYDFFETDGNEDTRLGFVFSPNLKSSNVPTSSYWPILRVYRIADPHLGVIQRGTWTLEPGKIIDGRNCVLVLNRWRSPGSKRFKRDYYFVDTDRGMVPVEFGRIIGEDTVEKLRVDYEINANEDWVPVGWHFDIYAYFGGKRVLASSREIVVTHLEFNQHVPDSEFEIEFPTGTIVRDDIALARGDEQVYIINADGSHRPITVAERTGQSFDEIRRNIADADRNSLVWWWVGLVLMFVVCVTGWVIRKKRIM